MADVSKLKVSNTTYDIKDTTARNNIADSGWQNVTQNQGTWTYAECRKIGKMVEVRGYITSLGVTSGAVLTLPSGYAPSQDIQVYGPCGWVTDPCIVRWYIGTNGAIAMDWCLSLVDGSSVTVNTWKKICITYMID